MASLSFARPGKFSARSYIGDLSGLFERQRRRAGIELTPESFASDLAANDTLRSSLFTLCNAISHMGENDISPEELLDLVACALGGAGSAEGETGTNIPQDMREAFLSGYSAWQNRDLHISSHNGPDAWSPHTSGIRKPPMRESTPEINAHTEIPTTGRDNVDPVIPTARRRTLQEALSMVRRENAVLARDFEDDAGNMTLGEIRLFLDEIESRVSQIGPRIQQLKSAAAHESERPAPVPASVIPFPEHRVNAIEPADASSSSSQNGSVRRRYLPSLNPRNEDALLTQPPSIDDRPPGIDALLAAARVWANATPTARGSFAPASLHSADPTAQPLAPASAPLSVEPITASTQSEQPCNAASLPPIAAPRIFLNAEQNPLLSPMERLQAYLLHLPPRRVFLALASLTVLAGGLAGYMAYRTMHTGHVPQLTDLEQAIHFSVPPTESPAPAPPADVMPKPMPLQNTSATLPRPKPHASPSHQPSVDAWQPPEQITPDAASSPGAMQPTSPAIPYVPPPTMIGYALATPQPAYPATANGITGTVSVEITVSRLGDVTSARAVSGPQELRAAAVAAVRGWRFRPYLTNGIPVEVSTTLQFFFNGE